MTPTEHAYVDAEIGRVCCELWNKTTDGEGEVVYQNSCCCECHYEEELDQ